MNDTPETDGKAYVSIAITSSGWKDGPLVVPVEWARILERQRDSQRQLAGELIASIKANLAAGTLSTATPELIWEWLGRFEARLLPYPQPERFAPEA
jgi:hypothetical protein